MLTCGVNPSSGAWQSCSTFGLWYEKTGKEGRPYVTTDYFLDYMGTQSFGRIASDWWAWDPSPRKPIIWVRESIADAHAGVASREKQKSWLPRLGNSQRPSGTWTATTIKTGTRVDGRPAHLQRRKGLLFAYKPRSGVGQITSTARLLWISPNVKNVFILDVWLIHPVFWF